MHPCDIAGRENTSGAWVVGFSGEEYPVSHIVWALVYAKYPQSMLDHKNGIKADCSIDNLREVTNSQNQANRCAPINNTSGAKGVTFCHGKYEARLRSIYIGRYWTLKEAEEAYKQAATKYFGEFAYEKR